MRRWTRWEDYVAGACGAYAALSVLWTERTMMSTILMVTFGTVLAVTAVLNLSLPGEPWLEWAQAAAGVLLFVSPWVGAYSAAVAPAWTSWIAGGLAAVTTTLAIRPAMRTHDHMASTH